MLFKCSIFLLNPRSPNYPLLPNSIHHYHNTIPLLHSITQLQNTMCLLPSISLTTKYYSTIIPKPQLPIITLLLVDTIISNLLKFTNTT